MKGQSQAQTWFDPRKDTHSIDSSLNKSTNFEKNMLLVSNKQ